MAMASNASQQYDLLIQSPKTPLVDELRQAKREIELLKTMVAFPIH
jgi:hypothetical protein